MTPPRRPFAEFSADVDALVEETERQRDKYAATLIIYSNALWDPHTDEFLIHTTTRDTLTNPEGNTE